VIKELMLLSAVIFFSISLFAKGAPCPPIGLAVFGVAYDN
tara:strand:- start:271 stop:390 length:120 start_codon:yes stop_codon:yes gene_type:complete